MTKNPAIKWPWIMMVSRISLFVGIQSLFALGFVITGTANSWNKAANWWPFVVTIANCVCIALLSRLFRQEGKRFFDIFIIQKDDIKRDLLVLTGTTFLLGPVSYLPNVWLGKLIFGDPQDTLALLIRPLPLWAAYASIVLFPVTQGIAELATYFSYVMPRLEKQGMNRWLAISVPSLFLAFQHLGVPALFNLRYVIWRGLMFAPFAFLAGFVMHLRPRLLPYLAVIHVLMDMAFAAMLLNVAY